MASEKSAEWLSDLLCTRLLEVFPEYINQFRIYIKKIGADDQRDMLLALWKDDFIVDFETFKKLWNKRKLTKIKMD